MDCYGESPRSLEEQAAVGTQDLADSTNGYQPDAHMENRGQRRTGVRVDFLRKVHSESLFSNPHYRELGFMPTILIFGKKWDQSELPHRYENVL
jgi:hypothetical protein